MSTRLQCTEFVRSLERGDQNILVGVEATRHETRNRKVRHTQEEPTQWTSVRLAKERANKARAKAKGSMDSKDNKDETRARTRTRIRLNVGTVEKRGLCSKDCWSKKNTNKGGSDGKHKSKNATDAHNLDSTKQANVEPEVEIGGFDIGFLGC